MVNESFFSFACAGIIGLLFGTALTFAGYRLFIFLLPIWGFFFGLALGAQTIQTLFGDAFLATVTSWVVGFVVGALFAVLSYLFYFIAVAVISGSLGYFAAVAIMLAIGRDPGFLVWLIGLIVGVVFIFVTFQFNLQKWAGQRIGEKHPAPHPGESQPALGPQDAEQQGIARVPPR